MRRVQTLAPHLASHDRAASEVVLVTGALGHYGRQVVAQLLSQKTGMVIATDMKPAPEDPASVWGTGAAGRLEYVQVDLGDHSQAAVIDLLVSRCGSVVHLGEFEWLSAAECCLTMLFHATHQCFIFQALTRVLHEPLQRQ